MAVSSVKIPSSLDCHHTAQCMQAIRNMLSGPTLASTKSDASTSLNLQATFLALTIHVRRSSYNGNVVMTLSPFQ